jgi:hypothetical protein
MAASMAAMLEDIKTELDALAKAEPEGVAEVEDYEVWGRKFAVTLVRSDWIADDVWR